MEHLALCSAANLESTMIRGFVRNVPQSGISVSVVKPPLPVICAWRDITNQEPVARHVTQFWTHAFNVKTDQPVSNVWMGFIWTVWSARNALRRVVSNAMTLPSAPNVSDWTTTWIPVLTLANSAQRL
jgi:hypothetical protein